MLEARKIRFLRTVLNLGIRICLEFRIQCFGFRRSNTVLRNVSELVIIYNFLNNNTKMSD
jgi:hypothetical protein